MSDKNEFDLSTDYESPRNSLNSNNKIIENISSILESLIEENKNLQNYEELIFKQKNLIFNLSDIPSISIQDYLYRIYSFSELEDSTLILSLIYIDKICDISSIILSEYNVYKILFIAILISIKYNEDLFYDNKYYARKIGVTPKELKKMEIEFLKLIQFELYVKKNDFEKYKKYIKKIDVL